MTAKLFCLVLLSVVALSFGASVRNLGCSSGDTKTDGKSICICIKDEWTCSFRNSSSCVSGSETLSDGTLNKETGAICLCTPGKLTCAQGAPLDTVKERVKRGSQKHKTQPIKPVKKKPGKKPAKKPGKKPGKCRPGTLKKEGTAKCLCSKDHKYKCSFAKGKDCKTGPIVSKDGSVKKEATVTCMCMDGKWECEEYVPSEKEMKEEEEHFQKMKKLAAKEGVKMPKKGSKPESKPAKKGRTKTLQKEIEKMNEKKKVATARKKILQGALKKIIKKKEAVKARKKKGRRVKRQRDTCKFGPKIVKHGEIYEFGTDCDCFNGNFKCNKYSRIRISRKRLSVQMLSARNADLDSNLYNEEVSTNQEFYGKSVRRTRAAKSTGASCQFVKNGEKITRRSGERFAYGLRCECTEGKISCTTKRV